MQWVYVAGEWRAEDAKGREWTLRREPCGWAIFTPSLRRLGFAPILEVAQAQVRIESAF
jgi:hypothetical protein